MGKKNIGGAVLDDLKALPKKILKPYYKNGKLNANKVAIDGIPFVIIFYVINKYVQAVVSADGGDMLDKCVKAFSLIFQVKPYFAPSFKLTPLICGIGAGVAFKLFMNSRKKNAKQFRPREEYGSAKWGTDKDFEPYTDSEHIDSERTKQNVYWDCYQGYSFAGSSQERQFNFTEIERAYYYEHYSDFVDAQNERNEQARHPERNRTIDDVLKNNKTCPEESVIQLGNIDHAVTPDVLAKVSAEFFDEFNKRYGSHIHILDWALHLDEATPHIHERHVFDAKNKYGELCPQQDKALEELGFELPDPAKKKGKYNNRKMNFDAECRKLFLEIAQRNGVQVECEPVYGGAGYLEKQDFIIENQKKRIAEKQAVLDEITMRVLDMENFVEQVAEDAYEKACEAVSDTMAEQTRAEDIEELRRYKKWLTSDERKTPKDKRDFVGRCLDNLENRLRGMAQKVAGKVMETLQNPRIKEQKKSEVKEHARKSVRALLEANRKLVEEQRAKVAETPAHKKARGEELG